MVYVRQLPIHVATVTTASIHIEISAFPLYNECSVRPLQALETRLRGSYQVSLVSTPRPWQHCDVKLVTTQILIIDGVDLQHYPQHYRNADRCATMEAYQVLGMQRDKTNNQRWSFKPRSRLYLQRSVPIGQSFYDHEPANVQLQQGYLLCLTCKWLMLDRSFGISAPDRACVDTARPQALSSPVS
jgi:hypothetical protein